MILKNCIGYIPDDFFKKNDIKNFYFEYHPKSFSFVTSKNIFFFLKTIASKTKLKNFADRLYEKFLSCFPNSKNKERPINFEYFLNYFILFPLNDYNVVENKVIESIEKNHKNPNYQQLDNVENIDEAMINFNKLCNEKDNIITNKILIRKNLNKYYDIKDQKVLDFISFWQAYEIFNKLIKILPQEYLDNFSKTNFKKIDQYIEKDIILSFLRITFLLTDLNYCKVNFDLKTPWSIQINKNHWYFKLFLSKDCKVEERNNNWMKQLVVPNSLFTVGYGHLIGKNSVISLLKQKGFIVDHSIGAETLKNFKLKLKKINNIDTIIKETYHTVKILFNNYFYHGLIIKTSLYNILKMNKSKIDSRTKTKIFRLYNLALDKFEKAKNIDSKIFYNIKDCNVNLNIIKKLISRIK